jgi:autotransporter-associated beta strand protein
MTRNAKAGVKRGAGRSRVRLTAAALAAGAGIAGISRQALAANGTWVAGGASATWTDSTNWASGAVPGVSSPGSTTNTDTATFNAAVGTFGTSGSPIVIPSNFNIENINFDTAAGNFYIGATGGNSIIPTTGGAIQILSTLTSTNAIETINAPLSLTASGTTFSLLNYSANGAGASAGTLNFGGAITGGGAGNATLTLGGTNTNANTISGVISNDISLVSAGSGLWVLTGANSYSGGTTISGGTLQIGNGTSGSISNSSAVSISAGTLAFDEANNATPSFAISNAGTIAGVEGSGITNTLSGVISGSGGFTQVGAGGTTLSNVSNSFTGNVQVSAGTLTLAAAGQSTNTSGVGANTSGKTLTVASGATLVTTANDAIDTQSTNVNNIAVTIQGTWNNNTGFQRVDNLTLQGATINDNGQAGSYGGILAAGTVTVSGSGPSTYNQLAGGVGLGLGGTGTTVPVTFNISITNSNDATIASDADFIVNGTLRDTAVSKGSLIKTGLGTMVLNSSSTYSGATTISAGTLRVNNPTAGTSATGTTNITVDAGTSSYGGGRLAGSGYVSGSVTLNTSTTQKQGGIIAAGQDDSTTGKLTTGTEAWSGGAAYEWKIGSLLGSSSTTNAAPGSGGSGTPGATSSWDDVVMSGLTVSSGGTSKPFTIALQNTATLTTASNTSTYSWIIAQSSAIPTLPGSSAGSLSATSGTKTANLLTTTPSGTGSDIFALDTSGWGSGLTINSAAPAGTFSLEFVNASGTYDLDLDYNAAPEPGTAMLITAGAAPLLLRRRRRTAAF